MKYCSHCGKQLDEEWTLCPYCGTKVTVIPAQTDTHISTKSSRWDAKGIAGLCVFVFIVTMILLSPIYTADKAPTNDERIKENSVVAESQVVDESFEHSVNENNTTDKNRQTISREIDRKKIEAKNYAKFTIEVLDITDEFLIKYNEMVSTGYIDEESADYIDSTLLPAVSKISDKLRNCDCVPVYNIDLANAHVMMQEAVNGYHDGLIALKLACETGNKEFLLEGSKLMGEASSTREKYANVVVAVVTSETQK